MHKWSCIGPLVTNDDCHAHKKTQKQRLKERSKSNFQIRNKTRLCDSKMKTQELKTKTQMCKTNVKTKFIMLTYVNMNMKKTWEGYSARLCLRFVLNKLKKMMGFILIYAHLGTK